jgi:hypothetical protein
MDIIGIIAVIALIALGIGYMNDMISKDKFYKWAKGVLIIGCATEIVALLGFRV